MIDLIIKYETGECDEDEFLGLFSQLIRTGRAWSLQGHYGRTAASLIECGIIAQDGTIDAERVEELRADM